MTNIAQTDDKKNMRLHIKEKLPRRYTKLINEKLQNLGLKAYTPSMITRVINGDRYNLDILKAAALVIEDINNDKSQINKIIKES